MHNMKKLFLSLFIFTFGGSDAATHAQQVKTVFTKQLPRCRFAEARFGGLVPGRCFTNHPKTSIP